MNYHSPIRQLRLSQTKDGWEIAFVFYNGEVHYGSNHPIILQFILSSGISWQDLLEERPVFGWVFKQDGVFKVGVSSETMQEYQSDDIDQIDRAFQAIRQKYPITELVYDQSWQDEPEDPRLAALQYIARQTNQSVI